MPTINIKYVPGTDQIYVDPPLAILTQSDQTITWNLDGGGVYRWNDDNGNVPIVFGPPAGGYSGWTGPTPQKLDDDTWFVNLNQPNTGNQPIYFNWMYQLFNTKTNTVRVDDPDIGNDPHP